MARPRSLTILSRHFHLLLGCCWLLALFTGPTQAGLHIGESPLGTLDAQDPVIVILYPTEPEEFVAETRVYFRWGQEDRHASSDPVDNTAYVTIDGELFEAIYYTPDPDQNEWEWTVPNQATDGGQFHVKVSDLFGNSTIADSPIFSILPVITGIEPDPLQLPDRLALSPPYPNPFNPATRIAFDLPSAGQVSLVVHDLQGRRVCELDRGDRPAGRYAILWQGQDTAGRRVAGGVYLVRLVFESEGGGQILTRKLVLLP